MNKILLFLFSVFITGLITGFYYKSNDEILGNKIIGFTVLTAAFIYMPIFLVHRWKGKKLKDYTLSKENFEKLRNSNQK